MKITVTSQAAQVLRLIDEIPDGRALWLEGRNGIGKTVTIRLLALAAGQQPYSGEEGAWRSLRDAINGTTIAITGLNPDDSRIEIHFTPERWPDEPEQAVSDRVATYKLNDNEATAEDVERLLHVAHVHGAERLDGIINRERRRLATAVRIVGRGVPDRTGFGIELGSLTKTVVSAAPARRAKFVDDASQLAARIAELTAARDQLRARVQRIERARLARSLAVGSEAAPSLENRRETVNRLDTAERAVQAEITRVLDSLSADESSRETMNGFVKRREQAASRIARRLEELAALSIDAGEPPADEQSASDLLRRAEAEVREREQALMDSAESFTVTDPRVQRAFSATEQALVNATDEGLGPLPLLRTPAQEAIDVYTTLEWLADGRDALEAAQPPAANLEKLRAELEQWSHAVEVAQALERDFRAEQRAIDGIQDLQSVVVAPERARQELEQLRSRAAELGRELQVARFDLGRAISSLGVVGEVSVATAQEILDEELRALEVAGPDALDEAAAEGTSQLAALAAELEQAETEHGRLVALVAEADDAAADLQRLIAADDPRLAAWDVDVAHFEDPGSLDSLADGVETALRDFNALWDELGAFQGALETGGRSGGTSALDRGHHSAIERVVESAITEQLNNPIIRRELFDGADEVHVSLARDMVTWGRNGTTIERPVAAFSSGEQAFAFTQAQLQAAAATDKPNALIALDEFGAFVAADRRRQLARLLHEQLERPGLMAVVIVPLQANYADEVTQTTGELREQFERRAADIERHGFFVEDFHSR